MVPLVYIIILNYNNYKDTIQCIESLEKINYQNYKVIIIDNNSVNESAEIIDAVIKKHKLIKLEQNLGFAGGCNIGIKEAIYEGAEYVLLLNNDTVVEPDFLGKLIESFHQNIEVGIVGGRINSYYDNNKLCEAGGYIDFFKFITTNGIGEEKQKTQQKIEKNVGFISGCCMLISKAVFDKVGFLPEEYFMYYEDTDFCVKVLEGEFKILYNSEAIIYHKIGSSGGGKQSPFLLKWNNRNRLIFMQKYKYKVSKIEFLCSKIYFYTTRLARILQYLINKDNKRANAIYEGIKEGRKYVQSKYYNTLL